MSKKSHTNQHYVPQFYLRNFANDNNGKSVSGFVLKSKKPIKHISIKETASEKFYYGETGEIEKWFSRLEGIWKPIIHDIIERKTLPLNENDYWELLYFVALSEVRAFKYGTITNKILNGLLDLSYRFGTSDKQYEVIGHPISSMDAYVLENHDIYEKLVPTLLVNNTELEFLTSDNPCAKYNQFFVARNLNYYSIRHKGIQLFLPLSPHICLCFYDGEVYRPCSDVENSVINIIEPSQINELNKLFLRNADLMIYFSNSFNSDTVNELVSHHKFYQHEPCKKTQIPIVGIQMESINDYFDLRLFDVRNSFIKNCSPH